MNLTLDISMPWIMLVLNSEVRLPAPGVQVNFLVHLIGTVSEE